MSDKELEWHYGWEPSHIGRDCYIELIGGETDLAKREFHPDFAMLGYHLWTGKKSTYLANEVRRWRYVPEPPKAPTPPPTRYERFNSPINTFMAVVLLMTGVVILTMLMISGK